MAATNQKPLKVAYVGAHIPATLADALDETAFRDERSRSGQIRQAIAKFIRETHPEIYERCLANGR